jgi:YebC/PmpR family DNA-binding regulatory protein
MAGHSKWANIKHRKGRQDARRSKMWSKCARAIIVAAKHGGPDPDANLTLRYAIDEAKAQNMPKDTIENAVKKGSGDTEGADYEEVIYEGYGPGGAAMMLDILTDNRHRTAPEVRKIFENHGGSLGQTGCVAFNFQQQGQIVITGDGLSEEDVMEAALEAGAEDIEADDDIFVVTTAPTDYQQVRKSLADAGYTIDSGSVTMVPLDTVAPEGKEATRVAKLIDALEDHDDVQNVYTNAELPDDALDHA